MNEIEKQTKGSREEQMLKLKLFELVRLRNRAIDSDAHNKIIERLKLLVEKKLDEFIEYNIKKKNK